MARSIKNQSDETWAVLLQRFIQSDIKWETILSQNLLNFIRVKSTAVGTNVSYFFLSFLTTISYMCSVKKSCIELSETHRINFNLFSIFVGPPTSAKSPAFKYAVNDALKNITDLNLFTSSTPSALTKKLAVHNRGFIINSEISSYLLKMHKNDDDNSDGNAQVLCKLFSGEKHEMAYATEQTRVIEENCSFCILGSTQVSNMAKIFSLIDNGDGLIDRFLVYVPSSLRPLPEERDNAINELQRLNPKSPEDIYEAINSWDFDNPPQFYFEDEALMAFRQDETAYIKEYNRCLLNGIPTSKSKRAEFIPKIAALLHISEKMFQIAAGNVEGPIAEAITLDSLQKAITLVDLLEEQKRFFTNIVQEISTEERRVKTKSQPTPQDIKKAILLTSGPVVTLRTFSHYAPNDLRKSILKHEFVLACNLLQAEELGRLVTIISPGNFAKSQVFIKSSNLPRDFNMVDHAEYNRKRLLSISKKSLATSIREVLTQQYGVEF
ncbi:uncharacterized protein [Clytia hemisphaerica]|uniref:DUF3987 domain-containing protein n=1 Tax=Clytia hemisphaerica TaxID=252671 RepID=A0A7M5UB27_9CNID